MVNNVGILVELKEYRSDIGVRVNTNAFGKCTALEATSSIFSDGVDLFVQDGIELFKVVLEEPIDCDTIYSNLDENSPVYPAGENSPVYPA